MEAPKISAGCPDSPHSLEEETEVHTSSATPESLPGPTLSPRAGAWLWGLLRAEPAPRSPLVPPSQGAFSQAPRGRQAWGPDGGRVAGSWGRRRSSPQERGGGVPAFQGALPVAHNEVLGEQVMKPASRLREAGPPARFAVALGAAPPPRLVASRGPSPPPATHLSLTSPFPPAFPVRFPARPRALAQASGSVTAPLVPPLKPRWEPTRGT